MKELKKLLIEAQELRKRCDRLYKKQVELYKSLVRLNERVKNIKWR